jgi:hypothetical protein
LRSSVLLLSWRAAWTRIGKTVRHGRRPRRGPRPDEELTFS